MSSYAMKIQKGWLPLSFWPNLIFYPIIPQIRCDKTKDDLKIDQERHQRGTSFSELDSVWSGDKKKKSDRFKEIQSWHKF
jgi:hypothetical protein